MSLGASARRNNARDVSRVIWLSHSDGKLSPRPHMPPSPNTHVPGWQADTLTVLDHIIRSEAPSMWGEIIVCLKVSHSLDTQMLCMWLIKGLKSVAAEDYERMCAMCVQVYSTSVQCTVCSTRIRRGCALCVWGVTECHYPRQLLTLFRYKLVTAAPEGSRGHVLLMTESGQVLTCNTSRHN